MESTFTIFYSQTVGAGRQRFWLRTKCAAPGSGNTFLSHSIQTLATGYSLNSAYQLNAAESILGLTGCNSQLTWCFLLRWPHLSASPLGWAPAQCRWAHSGAWPRSSWQTGRDAWRRWGGGSGRCPAPARACPAAPQYSSPSRLGHYEHFNTAETKIPFPKLVFSLANILVAVLSPCPPILAAVIALNMVKLIEELF